MQRFNYLSNIVQNSYLPTMPEDNFAECIAAIAEMANGQWYG